jgi:hypothetical protein
MREKSLELKDKVRGIESRQAKEKGDASSCLCNSTMGQASGKSFIDEAEG